MLNKNEAEKILRMATGQSKPNVGDGLFWTPESGWAFTPAVFIGAGLKTSATNANLPYSFVVPAAYGLLGKSPAGAADLFDLTLYDRVYQVDYEDNGAGAQWPTGEILIPRNLGGFVQTSLQLNYTGANNRQIDFALGVRVPGSSTVVYSPEIKIQTVNTPDFLTISGVNQSIGGQYIGVYLRQTAGSGAQTLTIRDVTLQLKFEGI